MFLVLLVISIGDFFFVFSCGLQDSKFQYVKHLTRLKFTFSRQSVHVSDFIFPSVNKIWLNST